MSTTFVIIKRKLGADGNGSEFVSPPKQEDGLDEQFRNEAEYELIPIAERTNSGALVWEHPAFQFLRPDLKVYPWGNTPQGIYTVGDILRELDGDCIVSDVDSSEDNRYYILQDIFNDVTEEEDVVVVDINKYGVVAIEAREYLQKKYPAFTSVYVQLPEVKSQPIVYRKVTTLGKLFQI